MADLAPYIPADLRLAVANKMATFSAAQRDLISDILSMAFGPVSIGAGERRYTCS
jgi:hypothetical protein